MLDVPFSGGSAVARRVRSFGGLLPRALALPLVLAVALLAGACSGGSQYSGADTSEMAQRYLATVSQPGYHPDSLRALSITEGEDTFKFEMEATYSELTRTWSSRPRDFSANRSSLRQYTYATLWSRELSLASLQPETAVTSLSKEQARKIIERREDEYDQFVQIDVYWFARPGNTIVAGPGSDVRLRTSRDSTYQPTRSDYGPIREAFLDGGRTATYRRNTFYFDRMQNGTDLLAETTEVMLSIRPIDSSSDFRFTWRWEEAAQAATGR